MRLKIILVGTFLLSSTLPVRAGPLHDAIKAGDQALASSLIDSGVDVDEVDFISGSPLHIASVKGDIEVVELLLESGADVNIEEFGKSDTPLHWAALGGFSDIIERLIIAGSAIDASNEYQNTPLHIAVESEHGNAAQKLIELGADVGARNQKGNSAMHLAGTKQLFDIVELLKEKGAQLPPPENIAPLLASASAEKGQELFLSKCGRCHAQPESKSHDVGPSLWDVVGRQQSTQDDFVYSPALRSLSGIWNFEMLNMFLLDSRNYFPGNAMSLGNAMDITSAQDRADIISYLRLQSSEPVPLP